MLAHVLAICVLGAGDGGEVLGTRGGMAPQGGDKVKHICTVQCAQFLPVQKISSVESD